MFQTYRAPRRGMRFCFARANAENTALSIVWGHRFFTDRREGWWVVVDGDASQIAAELNLLGGKHFLPGKHREITIPGKHRFIHDIGSSIYDSYDWREQLTSAERYVILESEYDAAETLFVLGRERKRTATEQQLQDAARRERAILKRLRHIR